MDAKALKLPVVSCAFFEIKGEDAPKIISFYAKRARGLMARYAIEHRITDPRKLKAFDVDGYAFAAADSDDERWVFRRKLT